MISVYKASSISIRHQSLPSSRWSDKRRMRVPLEIHLLVLLTIPSAALQSSEGSIAQSVRKNLFLSSMRSEFTYLEYEKPHSRITEDKNAPVLLVLSPTMKTSFDLMPLGIRSKTILFSVIKLLAKSFLRFLYVIIHQVRIFLPPHIPVPPRLHA